MLIDLLLVLGKFGLFIAYNTFFFRQASFCFFFQAEDGIRDRDVTGVQTCALPIFQKVSLMILSVPWPVPLKCRW